MMSLSIQDSRPYVPFATEKEGLCCLLGGTVSLSYGAFLKIRDYFQCRNTSIPYITDHAARFFTEIGIDLISQGVEQTLPTAAVIWTIYQIGYVTLNSEDFESLQMIE